MLSSELLTAYLLKWELCTSWNYAQKCIMNCISAVKPC